jgi:hypothetical protein
VRKQKASEQAQIRFVNKALNGDFKLLSMKTKSVIHTIAWIPKITATLFCVFGSGYLFAQSGQIDINRVRLMPDFPAPYLMRDWRTVAAAYDDLIFSTTATGEFLPLIHLKAEGVNYPSLQPILLDTYVGAAGMEIRRKRSILFRRWSARRWWALINPAKMASTGLKRARSFSTNRMGSWFILTGIQRPAVPTGGMT